MINRKIIW